MQYRKYLRAMKGVSGCGYDDGPHTGKGETFILSRTSKNNLKGKCPSNQPSQLSHQNQCVDSLSGNIYDEDGHKNSTDWNGYEKQVSQG